MTPCDPISRMRLGAALVARFGGLRDVPVFRSSFMVYSTKLLTRKALVAAVPVLQARELPAHLAHLVLLQLHPHEEGPQHLAVCRRRVFSKLDWVKFPVTAALRPCVSIAGTATSPQRDTSLANEGEALLAHGEERCRASDYPHQHE